MELIAQGVANIGSAAVGGIPATGAIARTMTNVKTGGRTPVAGMIHAFTILVVMLFFGRWIKLVPLASLAGILAVVSYNMSEWRSFRDLLRGSRGGALVLVTTFLLTVFIDLSVAIEIGMVLSAFLFMKRMADLTNVRILDGSTEEDRSAPFVTPKGVEIYEVNGPLFFGAAHKFEETSRTVAKKPKVRILRLRNVPLIDSTGLYALKGFHKRCLQSGIKLYIAGLHAQPLDKLVKEDLFDLIGEENVFPNIKEALDRAYQAMKS
jgi:SulP family sulfate permease